MQLRHFVTSFEGELLLEFFSFSCFGWFMLASAFYVYKNQRKSSQIPFLLGLPPVRSHTFPPLWKLLRQNFVFQGIKKRDVLVSPFHLNLVDRILFVSLFIGRADVQGPISSHHAVQLAEGRTSGWSAKNPPWLDLFKGGLKRIVINFPCLFLYS